MSNITMNIRKSTVTASAFLPGAAYDRAVILAEAYGGKIGKTANNRFTATFDNSEIAKEFKSEWTKGYKKAHAAYVPKGKGKGASAGVDKHAVRSWAWKEANGDNEKYIELCASKGVRAGA